MMKRRVAASLALALGAWCCPAQAAETSGEALVARWVAEAEAAGQTVTVGNRGYDAAKDLVEWSDVTVSGPSMKSPWKARALRFERVSERDGAYAAARIEADGIEASDQDGAVKIATFAVSDAFLPNFNAVPLPEKPSLDAVLQQLAVLRTVKLKLAEVRGITIDVPDRSVGANPGARIDIGFDRVAIEDVADGLYGRIIIAGVKLAGTEKGAPFIVGVNTAQLERINLGLAGDFLSRANYPDGKGDGVWHDLIGSYGFEGLSITAPEAQVKIGRYAIDGLALRRVSSAFLDLIAKGDDPEPSLIMTGLLGLADSIKLGRYGIDSIDVAFEAPMSEGEAPKKGRASLATIELRDVSLAGFGAYRIAGLDVAVEDIKVGLKEFVIGDVVFPSADAIVAAAVAAFMDETPNAVSLLPHVGLLRFAGIAVTPPGSGEVMLERFEIRQTGVAGALPTALAAELVGLKLPADLPEPSWRAFMAKFGGDALKAGMKLALAYDEKAETLSLQDLSVAVGEDGRASVMMALTGIAPELYARPDKVQEHLGAIGFGAGEIVLDDRGLSNRILSVLGDGTAKSSASLRKAAVDALPELLKPIPDSKMRAGLRKAFTGFLNAPSTLTVTAKPAEPVPALQVVATAAANPWRLLDILGVTVKTAP